MPVSVPAWVSSMSTACAGRQSLIQPCPPRGPPASSAPRRMTPLSGTLRIPNRTASVCEFKSLLLKAELGFQLMTQRYRGSMHWWSGVLSHCTSLVVLFYFFFFPSFHNLLSYSPHFHPHSLTIKVMICKIVFLLWRILNGLYFFRFQFGPLNLKKTVLFGGTWENCLLCY